MGIADRIEATFWHWADIFGSPLRGWMGSWVSWGIELLLDALGKSASSKLKPLIDTMEATGKVPPELKPLLDELKFPTGEIGGILASSASHALVGGAIGRILDSLLLPLAYLLSRSTRYVMPAEAQMIAMWLRGDMKETDLKYNLSLLGLTDTSISNLQKLAEIRLDAMSVITAWRRDKKKYEGLFQDLRDQGWTNDRIEALKFFTLYYPSPAELIHWTAREVFEPDKIKKYGLMADVDKLRREDFYKAGMDDEQINNHWIAHWEHASWMQLIEMLHRGIITEKDVKDWFPLVEIAPYWAENLIKVAYTWPTRVDIRRWWDMRTIDDARLKELYEGMGYRDKNLDDYILWTKVYVAFPDLLARFSKGWITAEDVKGQLIELGMPAARVEEMLQTKIEPKKPERTTKEKDLTKAEIYKGVKKEVISWNQGLELLQALGYDKNEAEFILTINVPTEETVTATEKRELTKTDIKAALKTEIISSTEAYSRLLKLGYIPTDAELLLKIYEAAAAPSTITEEKEASKADIVKGVKKGLISPEDAYLMLQEIGYSPEASEFILSVHAEESPFSPASFGEMYKQIEKYRQAEGRPITKMPEELIEAEKVYKQAQATLRRAESQNLADKELAPYLKALSDAEYHYRALLVEWEAKKEKD